jgi:flagella basal body P-ring formation protein FlgA
MFSIILLISAFFVNSGDSLKTDLDKYLKKNLTQFESFDYKVVQIPSDCRKLEIMQDRDFNLCGNVVYVPIDLITKTGRAIKSTITVSVKLYKNILVTSRQIQKNQGLSHSDVELRKMDVTQIKGSTLGSTKGIESFRTKIFLKSGEPILEEYIEPRPIILTGDKIEAKLTTGRVDVSFDAFSRQDGIPGSTITIISKDKRQYRAKVVDSLNVTIIE